MWQRTAPNGKIQFGENYKDPLSGKWKRVTVTADKNTSHTRKQAQIELDQKIYKILSQADGNIINRQLTLQELVDEWLPEFKKRVKIHTFVNNECRAKVLINDLGSDTLLEKLTPTLIADYLENLVLEGRYKVSSAQKFKGTLGNLLRFAVRRKYLKSNPVTKAVVTWPSTQNDTKPEDKYFDDDELREILEYMYTKSPHYGRFCEFLYLTGLRYGEAAALQKQDLIHDGDRTLVDINGTLINIGAPYKQRSPKTDTSYRQVSLSQRAIEIVAAEIKSQEAMGIDTDWIFVSVTGRSMRYDTLNAHLKVAKQKFDIPKKVTLHTFRHTHISKLAELGTPLYLIQNRVGHKDANTTKQIYLHVTKKAERQLDEKLQFL